jgi:hypothetical protein
VDRKWDVEFRWLNRWFPTTPSKVALAAAIILLAYLAWPSG